MCCNFLFCSNLLFLLRKLRVVFFLNQGNWKLRSSKWPVITKKKTQQQNEGSAVQKRFKKFLKRRSEWNRCPKSKRCQVRMYPGKLNLSEQKTLKFPWVWIFHYLGEVRKQIEKFTFENKNKLCCPLAQLLNLKNTFFFAKPLWHSLRNSTMIDQKKNLFCCNNLFF